MIRNRNKGSENKITWSYPLDILPFQLLYMLVGEMDPIGLLTPFLFGRLKLTTL